MLLLPSLNDFKKEIFLRIEKPRIEKKIKNKQLKMAFIVTHLRSGSSLLHKILISHSQMAGLVESHNQYKRTSDLMKVGVEVMAARKKLFTKHKFIVDRISGEEDMRDPAKFSQHKFIILLREPVHTMMEIFQMNLYYEEHPEKVYKLYSAALEHILRTARLVDPSHWMLVHFKDLMEKPSETTLGIEQFLGVEPEISENGVSSKLVKRTHLGRRKKKIIVEDENDEKDKGAYLSEKLGPYLDKAVKDHETCVEKLMTIQTQFLQK